MTREQRFMHAFVCVFDGAKDTCEEFRRMLQQKAFAVDWSRVECGWFENGEPENEDGLFYLRDELDDAIHWLFECVANEDYDTDAAWLECPFSDWLGNPVRLIITGDISDGSHQSDAELQMIKLYETILPLTTSEQVVLATRVVQRRAAK